MSDLDPRKGLERLSRIAEDAAGDDPRAATFVRGLVLGALVRAAIAGSTIWQRRRAAAERTDESDLIALRDIPAEVQKLDDDRNQQDPR
jgi:hypothetical protein